MTIGGDFNEFVMTGRMRTRPSIYHEKQTVGNMCALHAINNLLQGAYFTATVLARIGYDLDRREMALVESPSIDGKNHGKNVDKDLNSWINFDPSGNYSIQVIAIALSYFQLELISLHSSNPRAMSARQCTCNEQAFLCHKNNHWFMLRKFGSKWFNLNSFLPGPEEINHDGNHLTLFATEELIKNFTGIFIVCGNLELFTSANSISQNSNEEEDENKEDNYHNKKVKEWESKWSQFLAIIKKTSKAINNSTDEH